MVSLGQPAGLKYFRTLTVCLKWVRIYRVSMYIYIYMLLIESYIYIYTVLAGAKNAGYESPRWPYYVLSCLEVVGLSGFILVFFGLAKSQFRTNPQECMEWGIMLNQLPFQRGNSHWSTNCEDIQKWIIIWINYIWGIICWEMENWWINIRKLGGPKLVVFIGSPSALNELPLRVNGANNSSDTGTSKMLRNHILLVDIWDYFQKKWKEDQKIPKL